ncbi:SigB/SigF/SigG family RNA polymerase sigma factor, partial [Actinomadura adrarensis]
MRDALVERFHGLVRSLARRYFGRGEPSEDILQAGYVGLVKALDRFDPGKGPFPGYARSMILGEVKRHFRDTTWSVHVPRRIQELRSRLAHAAGQLTQDGAGTPTHRELADHLGLNEEEALQAERAGDAYRCLSLDAPLDHADGASLLDTIGHDDEQLELAVDLHALRQLLNQLPERERNILLMRFYGNMSQSEIAQRLGISQMHVSRLLRRTLDDLRRALGPGPDRSQRRSVPEEQAVHDPENRVSTPVSDRDPGPASASSPDPGAATCEADLPRLA